jgi:hypothetical protein
MEPLMDSSSRPSRKVGIADHIWDLFEDMASQMGSDRDALINQAMFMFARLNGFSEGAPAAAAKASGSNARPATSRQSPPVLAPTKGGPPQKLDDDPVRREVAERVLETAAELERLIKGKGPNGESSQEGSNGGSAEGDAAHSDSGAGNALYLMADGGELDRVAKDRFVIGRGKHCDFVINSGKVSREHAVIVRDGSDYYIEDLGCSNGTCFKKHRKKR